MYGLNTDLGIRLLRLFPLANACRSHVGKLDFDLSCSLLLFFRHCSVYCRNYSGQSGPQNTELGTRLLRLFPLANAYRSHAGKLDFDLSCCTFLSSLFSLV